MKHPAAGGVTGRRWATHGGERCPVGDNRMEALVGYLYLSSVWLTWLEGTCQLTLFWI